MPTQNPLSQWRETVSMAFPKLSRPQSTVLALWSYGMVLAKSCGITSVCAALALQTGDSEGTLTQRLREWCYDAKDKKGVKRQSLEVTTCFAPLLAWVLRLWPAEDRHLALAIDASTLTQRFTVLCVSVMYRGCAIPVAWKIVAADEKGSWQPYWKGLLTHLSPVVPTTWTVIVLSDRGLYALWLYRHIVSLGWHPFMRINQQGNFRPLDEKLFRGLSTVVPKVNGAWCGEVECFSERESRFGCTLVARWDEDYKQVWLVVTDLAPQEANVVWYGMRSWIEGGFKDTKRGGWQWHQTKMVNPARAERLWLAIAVATVWVLSVGGQADARVSVSGLEALPPTHIARQKATNRSRPRMLSCFARGWLLIMGAFIHGDGLLLGRFVPEPWPSSPPVPKKLTKKKRAAQIAQKAA